MSKARTSSSGESTGSVALLLAGVACSILLLWISFTATLKWHELLVGTMAMLCTMALFANLLRSMPLRFRLQLQDLLLVRQVPMAILKDCWTLLAVLMQDLAGGERAGSFYRACGFHTGMRSPLLVGRSALAIVYTTASPNMIVIGIDPAQSLMVFHQLRRDVVPAFAQALGAARQHGPALTGAAR